MSTKRIRTALAAMRSCIMSGEPWSQRLQADYINATADLEKIEQAGQAMASDMDMGAIRHAPGNIREAVDLMIEIGKETT